MCVYCNIGDWHFQRFVPWPPAEYPPWPQTVPLPQPPVSIPTPFFPTPFAPPQPAPWDVQRLTEFMDLLQRVKELEDKLGCPCEPNKADYLTLLRQRIEFLEKQAAAKGAP